MGYINLYYESLVWVKPANEKRENHEGYKPTWWEKVYIDAPDQPGGSLA
jgi:hypothetical protein